MPPEYQKNVGTSFTLVSLFFLLSLVSGLVKDGLKFSDVAADLPNVEKGDDVLAEKLSSLKSTQCGNMEGSSTGDLGKRFRS